MGDDRGSRDNAVQGNPYRRDDRMDYGQDYGSGRSASYSSARDYRASGGTGGDRDRGGATGGNQQYGAGRDGNRGGYDRDDADRQSGGYRGSYASDGHRFEDVGGQRDRGDDTRGRRGGGDYGRQPQGYDYQERGFFNRAGDEVRSWFGDDEAERRREMDSRHDERAERQRDTHRDRDYHSWRQTQIDALDRDYDEYRQENQQRFHSEFGQWRESGRASAANWARSTSTWRSSAPTAATSARSTRCAAIA